MAHGSRPLSPHLQIYRPQLSWVPSITHRFTGVALSVGTLLLVRWLVALASGPEAFETVQAFIGSWFGLLLLFGWTWSLFYHLANGIRHLVWDAGYGFELRSMELGAWIVIGSSVGLTLLFWIIGLAIW